MRLVFLVSVMSCFSISAPTVPSDSFNSDLSSLEDRFFMHEYADETADQRLDRLDVLVFGRVRRGSDEKRMTSLLMAVPNVQAKSVQPSSTNTTQGTSPLEPERPQLATAQPPQAASNESSDYYPTVTALEQQITAKTETALPVQQRLARLETVAFGKPSTSNNLSERVDLLKQYVARKNGGNESYLSSSNAVGWTSGNTGLAAEVSSMEQEVFGKTYSRDDLSSRLTRLEHNVLPRQPVQTFTPLAFRVNRLMSALNSARTGPINGAPVSSASWATPANYYPAQNLATSSYTQQPQYTSSYMQQPQSTGSYMQQPQYTSSYMQQPQSTGSYMQQPQSTSSYMQQPQSTSSYMQQPQSAIATAQNANQPKHHSLLRKLGVVLGDVGGYAERSMMYGGYGY